MDELTHIYSRKSSILNDKKQEIKIQAIHELLRDSLQRAADHRSAIQAEQSRSMDVMLNNLNSGFATVLVFCTHVLREILAD